MNTRFATKGKGISLLATTLILMASPGQAQAADILVPSKYPTIQAGIDAAKNGDTVIVANPNHATYTGVGNRDLNLKGKAITIRPSDETKYCIINCQWSGRAFYFGNHETPVTVVRGFTIQNGSANNGGAILCENNSNPTIANCYIWGSGTITGGSGGALCVLYSSPTVTGCFFQGNSAAYGSAASVKNGYPTFTNCTFANSNSTYYGGGVYNINVNGGTGTPTFTGCNFVSNGSGRDGGAMYNERCSPIIKNCSFAYNKAPGDGGGMVNFFSNPTISDSTFTSNTAQNRGGGMFNLYSNPTIINSAFTSNRAESQQNGFGGAIYNLGSSLTARQCAFNDNFSYGPGGAITLQDSALLLTGCRLERNNGSSGSGLAVYASTATINGCLFKQNQGVGVGNWDGGTTNVVNSIFAENYGKGLMNWGGNLTVINSTVTRNQDRGIHTINGSATITNCILWGNGIADVYGESISSSVPYRLTVTYSLLGTCRQMGSYSGSPVLPGTGTNPNADPLFVNSSASDYRLKAGSPAINKANTSALPGGISTDYAGVSRIRGGVVDMGAYEY